MKKFVLIVISASLFASCNIGELDFDNVEVQPITGVFSFPLGETNYIMRDIIGKQTGDSLGLLEDTTGLYTLVYFDTISYSAPDDFIQVPDIVQSSVITVPEASPAGVARTLPFPTSSFDFNYDPEGEEELDSVFYATGDLTIETQSDIAGLLSYSYTIVNTTNISTNNSVVIAGTIDGPGNDTQTQSLVNHKTKLTGGSDANTFSVILDASVQLDATDNVDVDDQISFTIRYANQTFNLVYGKFGQDTIQVGNQSIDLDFFSQSDREGITFGNPKMSFDFRNSFGVPIQVDFSGVAGDDGNGNLLELSGDVVRIPPVIASSDVNTPSSTTPGETVQSIIEINRSNSNIIQLLGSSPNSLLFNIEGITNADDAGQLNYFQNTSEISAYVSMEIPLEIQLDNLVETGTFGLGDGLDLDNVDSAFLRVVTINELPFSAAVTLDIKDADSTVLYSTEDNVVMVAPFININGEVTDPNGVTADIPLSKEGVEALATGAFIGITMSLSTPVSQTSREIYVKILADYELIVKVGVGGKLNLDL